MTDFGARIENDRAVHAANVVDLSVEPRIVPLADLTEFQGRSPSIYERYLKSTLDRIGAGLLLLLTLPILGGVALAIRLRMGSPVILKQERVGQAGRIFTLYKFRTMEPDRRTHQVPFVGTDRRRNHKDPTDPRITSLGRFLRKWSLDELPQFFNVLKGDMSLVGPRPELVDIVLNYEAWQHRRHSVKPGITGLWQISERGEKPLHECTESDIAYLEQLSVWTDLKVLALTPLAALGVRKGH